MPTHFYENFCQYDASLSWHIHYPRKPCWRGWQKYGGDHLCFVLMTLNSSSLNLSTRWPVLSGDHRSRCCTPPQDVFCWYHAKFNAEAKKCRALQLGQRETPRLASTGATSQNFSDITHTFCYRYRLQGQCHFPVPSDRQLPPNKLMLTAVNDTPISKRSLTLELGLRRQFPWVFVVANVQRPIPWADFLRDLGLVDMKQRLDFYECPLV